MGVLDSIRRIFGRADHSMTEADYAAMDAVHHVEDRVDDATGGRFYEAENVDDLREAYDKMGSLVSKVERKQEVTFAFLAGGLVLLLAAAAVAVITFPRLP